MKAFPKFLILPLLLLLTASLPHDNAAQARLVKKQLTALLAACKSNDYTRAAKYIVYRGPDKRREWKSAANYSNEAEQESIRGVCDRIGASLTLDATPEFARFTMQKEGTQEWGAWELVFEAESQQERILFAFVKVRGKYLLGDIDDVSGE